MGRALRKNAITLVHFMAYPGRGGANAVLRGEADAAYLLGTVQKVLADPYFGGVEVTHVKDPALRARLAALLEEGAIAAGKKVFYGAQPVQLVNEEGLDAQDISSPDEVLRRQAVARLKECIDEAYMMGAAGLGLISGRDPGAAGGLRARDQATAALVRSLDELCRYAAVKAPRHGQAGEGKPLVIALELFDRLPEPGCKNQLVGPASEAVHIARAVRDELGNANFGLLYDLSHMPLLQDAGGPALAPETPEVLRQLAPYLVHVHVGNCVTAKTDPLYGDFHPSFAYPGGAVTEELLAQFVAALVEIGYEGPIGFEVSPHGAEEGDQVVLVGKAYFDKAAGRPEVLYGLGAYRFIPERFAPDALFDRLTELRVAHPEIIKEEAGRRRRRGKLTHSGKLTILACDHPARLVTRVGDNSTAMGDRRDYLARILRVLLGTDPAATLAVDGVMTTPDIMDDLFLVNYLIREAGGKGFLDEKVLIGCMNRGGLAGTVFEMDDRMTAYTAAGMKEMGLDAGKIMFRLDVNDRYSGRTIEYCADAINECNAVGLPVFLEPLPVENVDGRYRVKLNAADLIRTIGVASALGASSAGLWLKIPYVENYATVARATTLPVLMLGGEPTGNPVKLLQEFERGMASGNTIRGALVGRNVLYPGQDDPLAVACAVRQIVAESASVGEAVEELVARRGADTGVLKAALAALTAADGGIVGA